MTVLNDAWISENGPYIVEGFNPAHVNPASYDITVANHWILPHRSEDDFYADSVILQPGEVVLATTIETVTLPQNVVADLKLKSSLGRLFLNHSMSGWIDPGFSGQITLEFQNIGPSARELVAGTRVAQLVFLQMNAPAQKPYNVTGHYNNQKGTTKSWTEAFFEKTK
jgi:dCTP deaminase